MPEDRREGPGGALLSGETKDRGEETRTLSRGNHGPWRRRRTPIFLALPLLVVALSFAVSGVASGASGGKAARLHPTAVRAPGGGTVTAAQSPSRPPAETEPSLLRRPD